MISNDTIAAISTAPGMGAIAIVRLSGPLAFAIAAKIFHPPALKTGNFLDERLYPISDKIRANLPLHETQPPDAGIDKGQVFKSHYARLGRIVNPASLQAIDEVILVPYKSPHTYTGEDLIEINCHGGWLVPNEILSLCLRMGARLARPGEFTQRAFLSGRIDLTQAESVLDLIQAKTARQGRMAVSALSGELGSRIKDVRSRLIELLARITAGIDFPDEVGQAPAADTRSTIDYCRGVLDVLMQTARSGRFLREGIRLAIVGRPNAGKSSLLNQLLKFERAIVTDTPGTTRDSLEELLDLNGLPVILIDTAGIRATDDHIEKMGIERTVAAINQSDLVLFLFDLTQGWAEAEEEIVKLIGQTPYILIGNKLDLVNLKERRQMPGRQVQAYETTEISAVTGAGLDNLTSCLEKWTFAGQSTAEHGPSLNARQAALCLLAAEALEAAGKALSGQLPEDCLATDLKEALNALSEVSGEAVSEEVIHQVFAAFCIGK